jgi:hypothetical protein
MQKTMEITRDVVLDLLPGYFGGEASTDTRRLVESWFAGDPEFAPMAQKLAGQRSEMESVEAAREKGALEQTRKRIRSLNAMMGFAIACSLAPFSFSSGSGGVRFFMPRDNPLESAIFGLCGLGCWIAWFLLRRKTRSSGV